MCMAVGWFWVRAGFWTGDETFPQAWSFLASRRRGTRLKKRQLPMKTIPVSSLLAGMLLPAVCHAQVAAPKNGGPMFGEAWNQADQDHDGKISKAEFKAIPRVGMLPEEKQDKIFERLDKDDDGVVCHDEISGFGRPHDGKPMRRLWELDADKSGGISLDEFKQGQIFKKLPANKMEGLFHRLDTDGDGLITPRDKPEPPPKRDGKGMKNKKHGKKGGKEGEDESRQVRLIRALDADGDGNLTFAEFRVGPDTKELTEDEQEDQFEKLDRNHDHRISSEDFPPASKMKDE